MTVPMSVFQDIDAILLTHRHFDHWDKKALSVLDKGLPVLCQPKDQASVLSAGFSRALPVDESLEWEGISIKRIQGIHAYGLTGKLLGPVSGFILDSAQQGSVYIVGDCMLTPAIEDAFRKYAPDIAIVNTGEAQMIWGAVITMTREDVLRLARLSTKTKLAAVHMDAINHCKLSRRELEVYLREQHCDGAVWIPEDGEVRIF